MKLKTELKTAAAVRADFDFRGESITGWAIARGFSPNQVFSVLSGRNKGKRGRSHKIAVLLGLKRGALPSENERAERRIAR